MSFWEISIEQLGTINFDQMSSEQMSLTNVRAMSFELLSKVTTDCCNLSKIRGAKNSRKCFYLFKWGLGRGPEQRESKMTVLCLLINIILICYIIIYYIIIKLLIMENHPSQKRKWNSLTKMFFFFSFRLLPTWQACRQVFWAGRRRWAGGQCYKTFLSVIYEFSH